MANEFKAKNGVIAPTLQSTVSTGTAPLTVASSTVVTNLNADKLDGQEGSYYTTADNLTGTLSSTVLGNSSLYIGTTQVALNRSSNSQSLTGVSIDGSAGSATTATNVSGGDANKIVYQSASNTSAFIDAPTTTDTYLKWSGSAFTWATVEASGGVSIEDAQDAAASLFTTGTHSGISFSYDDANGKLNATVTGGGGGGGITTGKAIAMAMVFG